MIFREDLRTGGATRLRVKRTVGSILQQLTEFILNKQVRASNEDLATLDVLWRLFVRLSIFGGRGGFWAACPKLLG